MEIRVAGGNVNKRKRYILKGRQLLHTRWLKFPEFISDGGGDGGGIETITKLNHRRLLRMGQVGV